MGFVHFYWINELSSNENYSIGSLRSRAGFWKGLQIKCCSCVEGRVSLRCRNFVGRMKSINEMHIVFHGTISEGSSSAAGSSLDAPVSSHPGIRLDIFLTTVEGKHRGGSKLCPLTAHSAIDSSMKYCESPTWRMVMRNTKKMLVGSFRTRPS